jgi:hypothetical protein
VIEYTVNGEEEMARVCEELYQIDRFVSILIKYSGAPRGVSLALDALFQLSTNRKINPLSGLHIEGDASEPVMEFVKQSDSKKEYVWFLLNYCALRFEGDEIIRLLLKNEHGMTLVDGLPVFPYNCDKCGKKKRRGVPLASQEY